MDTEKRNPRTPDIDLLDTLGALRLINREDRQIAAAIEKILPQIARAVEGIAARLAAGGRLVYVGAGTSGRLGILDAVECSPTFGVDPELVQGVLAGGEEACYRALEASEDNAGQGEKDLSARGICAKDAVVAITASGRTPYTLGAARWARGRGAFTVGLSCNSGSPLSNEVDVAIEVEVGPEVIAGSTRMKAGTAEKMVLNMISTVTMVRLAHVYSNLMVNVRLKNEKLVQRAVRIIAAAAGTSTELAREALQQADDVRAAIVMLKLGCDVDKARKLASEKVSLREILGER